MNQRDFWHGDIDSRNKVWRVSIKSNIMRRAVSQTHFRTLKLAMS